MARARAQMEEDERREAALAKGSIVPKLSGPGLSSRPGPKKVLRRIVDLE